MGPTGTDSIAEGDFGWIAQFYLRRNPFFFQAEHLEEGAEVRVQLERAIQVENGSFPTYLYPDPDGRLALVTVLGGPGDPAEANHVASDVVGPLLDALSVRYDTNLRVVHSLTIGVPSGIIYLHFKKPSPLARLTVEDGVEGVPRHPDLAQAFALYREGISSPNPLHQFLTLFRTYEAASRVRNDWRVRCGRRRTDRRGDRTLVEEAVPQVFAFGGHIGQRFSAVADEFREEFRHALAHGVLDRPVEPITSAFSRDVERLDGQVSLMRYMAYTVIRNVESCLDASDSATEATGNFGWHSGQIDWRAAFARAAVGVPQLGDREALRVEFADPGATIPRQEWDRREAVRCAAKATLAVAVGWDIDQISVVNARQGGGYSVALSFSHKDGQSDESILRSRILVGLAGIVAEQHAYGTCSHQIAEADLKSTGEAVGRDVNDISKFIPDILPWVVAYWRPIERLAHYVLHQGAEDVVSGSQIRDLIARPWPSDEDLHAAVGLDRLWK